MTEQFTACLAFTLSQEGGFVDNPQDPGGATNLGITLAVLQDWRDENCTAEDVRALTRVMVQPIYGARYWNPVQGDRLPSGIDLMVFDHGVNCGPPRAAAMLQSLLHVPADGHIGPMTLAALAKVSPGPLIPALHAAQRAFYLGLHNAEFERGWLNRTDARQAAALAIARAHPS